MDTRLPLEKNESKGFWLEDETRMTRIKQIYPYFHLTIMRTSEAIPLLRGAHRAGWLRVDGNLPKKFQMKCGAADLVDLQGFIRCR
jgi:hypothetical protein